MTTVNATPTPGNGNLSAASPEGPAGRPARATVQRQIPLARLITVELRKTFDTCSGLVRHCRIPVEGHDVVARGDDSPAAALTVGVDT
jgi:hypothetical protein